MTSPRLRSREKRAPAAAGNSTPDRAGIAPAISAVRIFRKINGSFFTLPTRQIRDKGVSSFPHFHH
jgi:hypothetical protein